MKFMDCWEQRSWGTKKRTRGVEGQNLMPLMLKEILKSKIVNPYRRKAVQVESNIHGEIDDSKI